MCQIHIVIIHSIHKVCQDRQKETFAGSKVNLVAETGNKFVLINSEMVLVPVCKGDFAFPELYISAKQI